MSVVLATGGSKALWFATRGAGAVAFLALTATVVLGIAGAQGLRTTRLPRFVVTGLHRNLTVLALVLLGIHIGTAVADTYAPIGLRDAVVPFASAYRPFWLGLGAVAFDLLLAVAITSALRLRIGFRRWKQLHWLAYAAWPVALVHALGTGSDARIGWMQLVAAASTLAVLAAAAVRVTRAPRSSQARLPAAAAIVAMPVAVFVWYVSGPARHGWAARAGTPAALVAKQPVVRRHRIAAVSVPSLPPPPFTVRFTGTLRQTSTAAGLTLVDIRGLTEGAPTGRLWIRLQGAPAGGGVSLTASGVSFGTGSWPNEYVGSLTALEGTRLGAALRGRSGSLDLVVDLSIDRATSEVSGVVRAVRAGDEQ
jgi:DMSO/TMAO reductase YedYZ heme-binding membrane subunit